MSKNEFLDPSKDIQPTEVQLTQPQRPKDFDYLDFRENEKTLEQLRQQNMNSYARFLGDDHDKPKADLSS